jgi:predicted nucleotidyltransferase
MVSTKNKVSIEKTWYNKSMITDSERQTIVGMTTKYHAKRVLLFGSALSPDEESSDIDIGVEGIDEKDFFTFYGELLCALSKPVDVIDLSITSRFSELVNLEGMSLYA